ncbi:uncharacterized protein LOC129235537 [Anastrepha obliqua]|uniref:uncharacterized protein LOC129235537 n=1 Tax=Anastrepha obliqua TaxID=95512 RepID=UPI00240A0E10|nr:uncharacterized protein LOC129235537 [Anastrepha obliqua]XP_054725404.1 uncharacterized protein LOC129235537 [Anastrepha obliqua]
MPAFKTLLQKSRHFKYLSFPRERFDYIKPEWKLTAALKHYKPSKRIIELAQPVNRGIGKVYSISRGKKSNQTTNYQPSKRIIELAVAPVKPPANIDKRKYPYLIPSKALRAKPTRRILELAAPKEYESFEHLDPWAVPKSALRAKASQRIEMLSKPKRCASVMGHSKLL